jgi:dihydrolipoamide dehydrogenase
VLPEVVHQEVNAAMFETDLLVVGGGPGGYTAACHAAGLGLKVTLVEKERLGGVCLHQGCIPSKALIEKGELLHRMHQASGRGLLSESLKVDAPALQIWKEQVIGRLERGVQGLVKGAGVSLLNGEAVFTSAHTVQVIGAAALDRIHFQSAIIATGSQPASLRHLPFDGVRVIDSSRALSLRAIPPSLAVVGGGYIGLELATAFRKLGSQVTVVEALPTLLGGMTSDLRSVLERRLRQLGIGVEVGAQPLGLTAEGLRCRLRGGEEVELPATQILVAVGRRPNTAAVGLSALGLKVDEQGYIAVDKHCRTVVPHVFAIGDVTRGPLLAHRAAKQGRIAAAAAAGGNDWFDEARVPAVLFTDPEIAYVGLNETQAEESGHVVAVSRLPLAALGRAHTMEATEGLIKLVAERGSGLLLGVQIAGPHASELIHEAVLALEVGATAEQMARAVHPHPTLGEGLMEAAQHLLGKL